MKVPAAVAEILKREGVEFLIGYPVNTIIEASAQADIRTIIVRQERTGIHMADAVSRLTSGRRIGVFAMQHGPGAENSFGGIAQAYGDSVPIVILPGGYPRRLTNVPPNFNAFLNELRTEEACRILADPANERVPIFNLALDLGYGSVGPFNRAFRAKTGQTPTEYRQIHLKAASASTETPAES